MTQQKLLEKGCGIQLDNGIGNSESIFCNLRFADASILMASAKLHLKDMIRDLIDAAAEVGLEVHFRKAKILTNRSAGEKQFEVAGNAIDIVHATEYLGRMLSLKDTSRVEVEHRINKAWKKFMALKGGALLAALSIAWPIAAF